MKGSNKIWLIILKKELRNFKGFDQSQKNIQICLFYNEKKGNFVPTILVQLKEKNQLIRFGDILRALESLKEDYSFLIPYGFYPSYIKGFESKKKLYSFVENENFNKLYSYLDRQVDNFLNSYSLKSIDNEDTNWSNLLIKNVKVFLNNLCLLNKSEFLKNCLDIADIVDESSPPKNGLNLEPKNDIGIEETNVKETSSVKIEKEGEILFNNWNNWKIEKEKTLADYLNVVQQSSILHEEKDILEFNIQNIISLLKANVSLQLINSSAFDEQKETLRLMEKKIEKGIENIDEKLKLLLHKKERRINHALPLREPICYPDFQLILSNAGLDRKMDEDNLRITQQNPRIRIIQLKIIYSLLYYFGLRLNETSKFTYEMFEYLWENNAISLVLSKTNQSLRQPVSDQGKQAFLELKPLIDELYKEHEFAYLGCSSRYPKRLMGLTNYRGLVNIDLECTCKRFNLPKYTSHSFRIGYITNLLSKGQLQQVSKLIGHKSVQTTMLYYRFAEDESIQELLNQSFSNSI